LLELLARSLTLCTRPYLEKKREIIIINNQDKKKQHKQEFNNKKKEKTAPDGSVFVKTC
jgi:hypothetical protein